MKDAILVNLGLKIKIDVSKVVKESILIQQAIADQLFEIKHMLTPGQFFQLTPNLKQYVFSKFFVKQKLVPPLPSIPAVALVAIDPHMVIIQVHVGRNLVDDVLLNEGFGANIITEDLKKRLGLPSAKLAPYMLQMADRSLMKPIKIIRDLKIHNMEFHTLPHSLFSRTMY
jgi:hypothetical protein